MRSSDYESFTSPWWHCQAAESIFALSVCPKSLFTLRSKRLGGFSIHSGVLVLNRALRLNIISYVRLGSYWYEGLSQTETAMCWPRITRDDRNESSATRQNLPHGSRSNRAGSGQ